MFGIGLPELLLIMALALIVLGPEKLPQVARQLAKFVGELKKTSEEFKKQLELDTIKEIRERNIWDLEQGFGAKGFEGSDGNPPTDKGKSSETMGGLGPEWQEAKGPKKETSPEHKDNGQAPEKQEVEAGTGPKDQQVPEKPLLNKDPRKGQNGSAHSDQTREQA